MAVLAWVGTGSDAAGATLPALVDDRGEPIEGEIEICWYRGLDRSCDTVAGSFSLPDDFEFATVEGFDHGPVTLHPDDLDDPVMVPRKATLSLTNLPDGPNAATTVSLYRANDRRLRKPWKRWTLDGSSSGHAVRIPSGSALLSVASRGRAPDLHLVEAEPGATVPIAFRPAAGWSLVVRVLRSGDDDPVPDAQVAVEALPGYGPTANPVEGRTQRDGLAVFSGITGPLVSVRADSPSLLPQSLAAVTSSPATFGYEEIRLDRGGSLAATITLDGQPLPDADCRLRRPFRPTRPGQEDPHPPVVATRTDSRGLCDGQQIPPGPYLLEITPASFAPDSRASISLEILEGVEERPAIDLRSRVLRGTVTRGDSPASDLLVEVRSVAARGRPASPRPLAVAPLDEEGAYEARVWQGGTHGVVLATESGTPVDIQQVRLDEPETILDFELTDHDLEGSVVDQDGQPVSQARVTLIWKANGMTSHQFATAAGDGTFVFPLRAADGSAEVRASKTGYADSPAVPVVLEPPTPVTLSLTRQATLSAVLLTAAGPPVIDAWVGSFRPTPAGPSALAQTSTAPDGTFEIRLETSGPTDLWLTGPGCPLHSRRIDNREALDGEPPIVLTCPPFPASLDLTVASKDQTPQPGLGVHLRRGSSIVPAPALHAHQARTVELTTTDGQGRLTLIDLAPGEYDVFLAANSEPALTRPGQPDGFVTTVQIRPLEVRRLAVTLD